MGAYRPEDLIEEEGLGTLAREVVSEHPFLSLGAGLSTVVMAAVAANALWFQPEPHPAPLFATRAPIAAETIEVAHKPVKVSAPAQITTNETERELLQEVQTALAARGYYRGKVDGIAGSRTRVAIERFQRDSAMAADGEASVRLLTKILMAPASKPVSVPAPVRRAPAKADEIETASVEKIAPANPTKMVVAIQRGLRNYGRHELTVDGKMGAKTARAIADFELDFGWDITGKPTPKLVKKLEEIGLLSG